MTPIETALLEARLIRPYYARALAALTPISTPGLRTFAVDKYFRLYYDPVFLSANSDVAGAIIAAHEIEHLLRDHAGRQEKILADPISWNYCADAEINDDLGDLHLRDMVTPSTLGMPAGQTAEQYYAALPDPPQKTPCCGGGSGTGRPLETEAPPPSDRNPGLSPDETETLKNAVANDIREHARRGTVPDYVRMWADARAAKKTVDWRRALTTAVVRVTREIARGQTDYSYSVLHRRAAVRPDLVMPGMVKYNPTIGVVVDTSASMATAGSHVLGWVKKITSSCGSVIFYECDTVARRTRGKKWTGGGGTNLKAALVGAEKTSDLVIVLTDGETPWVQIKKPVIVIAPKNAQTPGWAKKINL